MSDIVVGKGQGQRIAYVEAIDANGNAVLIQATMLVDQNGNPLVMNANMEIGGTAVSPANPLAVLDAYNAPAAITWTSATALNSADAIATAGYDTVIVTLNCAAGITGGGVTFEVYDGAQWIAVKASNVSAYSTASTQALSGSLTVGYQVPVAGFPQFRVRLSTAITGAGNVTVTTITSSAPDVSLVTVGLDPAQPLPAGTNAIGIMYMGYMANGSYGANPVSIISPATAGGASIKASAGRLIGWVLTNSAASMRSVKFFNATSVTMGTTAAAFEIDIPAGGMVSLDVTAGIGFSTGIMWAVTAGKGLTDNTSTGLAANDVSGVVLYA